MSDSKIGVWRRSPLLRKLVREILALTFWLHSLFLFHLGTLPTFATGAISRYSYNGSFIAFILYYSYISPNGWFAVLWDILFIYGYPFVLLKRAAWLISRKAWGYFRSSTVSTTTKLIPLPESPSVAVQPTIKDLLTQKSKESLDGKQETLTAFLFRPFIRFTLLWAILSLSINQPFILGLIACICIVGAGNALWSLQALLSDTSSWTAKLQSNFAAQMAANIAQIIQWNEEADPVEASKTANVLKVYEVTFGFIAANKSWLSKMSWFAAIAITIPFYIYISFLLASSYFAIAKIDGISWSWTAAFIDSLYIPFAFTDLPKSWVIRGIAGLQAISITVMGWNIFVRHLNGKFEALVRVATELRDPLLEERFRSKLRLLEMKVEQGKTTAKTVPERDTTST